MLSRCHVSPGALHEGRLFPITCLLHWLLGKQTLSFGYFKLCSSWAWKRHGRTSLWRKCWWGTLGIVLAALALQLPQTIPAFASAFASQLEAHPAPGRNQTTLQDISVSGRCGRNSPGFPSAHKPSYSRLELVSLVVFWTELWNFLLQIFLINGSQDTCC